MSRTSLVAAALPAVYAAFWVWYGGEGAPLCPDEVDRPTEAKADGTRSRRVEPDLHLLQAFRTLAGQDDGRELSMANLLHDRFPVARRMGEAWIGAAARPVSRPAGAGSARRGAHRPRAAWHR